jgi:hypothetical protein
VFEEIEKAILEVQQPRSRFQLEKFVLGQHQTPEMQYYQVCIELQDMIYKLRIAELNNKKTELKINRLRATGDELDELEAQELELSASQSEFAILGAKREIAHLVDIFNSFKHKYSREEIETAQPDYWKAKLTNTARAQLMGGSVNAAQVQAMEQAGILGDFISEVEESRKELAN